MVVCLVDVEAGVSCLCSHKDSKHARFLERARE